MKIISIDCGIKNLAICIITINSFTIEQLKDIQLLIQKINEQIPQELNELLSKIYTICLKKTFNIHYWENINLFPVPKEKCDKCTNISKWQNKLSNLCQKHYKLEPKINKFKEIKEKNTKTLTYLDISIALTKTLDTLKEYFGDVDKIFIEQQPQKNNRMKYLQMLIFQYFVMRLITEPNKCCLKGIHFVSPKHKLRYSGAFYAQTDKKTKYQQNKDVSVKQTLTILKGTKWYDFINNHTKKDDYCDCFLQAIAYYDILL